jgi:hypothetical protein
MGYETASTYTGKFELTFPFIVLQQIQIIQRIYSMELRDKEKIFKNNIGEQVIEDEDTRYSFLQSVEMFGSLLYPYFISNDNYKGIKKEEFEEYCDLLDKELVEIIDDDNFKKIAKNVFFIKKEESIYDKIKNDASFKSQLNAFFLNYKIKEARKVFRRLIGLFKEHDFLANKYYTDSADVDSSDVYDESKDELLWEDR